MYQTIIRKRAMKDVASSLRFGIPVWKSLRGKTAFTPPVKILILRSDVRKYFRMENFWTSGLVDKNKAMVESLQRYGVIRSNKVAEVMERIDRGLFVPSGTPAYVDCPMQIGYNATISAPHMHATCLELLKQHLQPGMRALDVGSGTGYLTACFAVMVGPQGCAVGVEHIPELASFSVENIRKSSASSLLEGSLSVHISGAMETIGKMLDRCGKKLEDNTRKASELAGNVWNHFKTGSSISDVTMAKLAHGTKVLANGGSDKMFQQTFGICAGERLQKAYACYLSTSTGPVIGTLYLSSLRLAFCSDNPLFFHLPSGQQEWIYYKVIIQLNQLAGVNPSSNSKNPAEKYIQIVTSGNHEFWFMGFVSYDKALKNLRDALQHREIKYMH